MDDSHQFDKSPYPSENRGAGTSTFYSVDLNNTQNEKPPSDSEQPAAGENSIRMKSRELKLEPETYLSYEKCI